MLWSNSKFALILHDFRISILDFEIQNMIDMGFYVLHIKLHVDTEFNWSELEYFKCDRKLLYSEKSWFVD